MGSAARYMDGICCMTWKTGVAVVAVLVVVVVGLANYR
jgi:hypothetical protein